MELGITPIITSGMVFQLLAGTHLIDVNLDLKTDRELYQTAQKVSLGGPFVQQATDRPSSSPSSCPLAKLAPTY